ncbi:serine/threonine-protein phosphatase 4 regulatory subunit 2-A-like isoform X2 [Acanthaster planci]|uniref:Serine/threonine-protein phosphatase 4 regulatory subunit 2-A-like isoform X2 n=1 Tax=Acanthaster planci TaxID=133434 RepID=A0A8B7Z8F3_ACAPL|nr:serine/threonine-protein phosphatase 4 regulatory subunit 2-A-like isoform X2 [Acanthaster planci]
MFTGSHEHSFERKPSREIPSELEQLLCRIARNGEPLFPWSKLKPLVVTKLENVIQEYIQSNPCEEVPVLPNVENVKFDDMRERLLRALHAFNSAPFTMQRLCELLTHPKRYYQRSDKFMRGVEKNVQVVSTVTPTGKRITHSCEIRNPNLVINGFPSDIHTQTSTPSSDSQASGDSAPSDDLPPSDGTTPSDGIAHTNGQEATGTQPLPDAVSSAPEQSVDSTGQNVEAPAAELETDQANERTTSSDHESPLIAGDPQDGKESATTNNEADACKPMEVADTSAAGDSDDSDGNKGDADHDSCSSMDSADSGDSSPDSALPSGPAYFDTLPPKDANAASDPTPAPTGPDLVDSSTDVGGSTTEEGSSSKTTSALQPDQTHSIFTQPSQEEQVSPLVTSAATSTVDTPADHSEAAVEPSDKTDDPSEEPASQSSASSEQVSQSDGTSKETAVEAEIPMEHK